MNEPSPAKYLLFKNKILQNEKGKKFKLEGKRQITKLPWLMNSTRGCIDIIAMDEFIPL